MKKSYLMIAAAAGLMLAACSQEDDFVAQNAAAQQGDGAVLFDTYLSNNSTRAGQTGVMTTTTLQQTGFGIVAYTHSIAGSTTYTSLQSATATEIAPNFMWNQYVGYQASNWVYNPLKYWPNETAKSAPTLSDADQQKAQASDKEGVSFMAYAPFVKAAASTADRKVPSLVAKDNFKVFDGVTPASDFGLISMTANTTSGDAMIEYQVSASKPSKSVDLLWGTSSGFTYHPVSTNAATVMEAGLPVLNMEKPALDEKIKFDFKHALARIGLTVVGAFDQVAVGGKLDQNTRITVKSVTVKSKQFKTYGVLDLTNTEKGVAKWLQPKSDNTGLEGIKNATTDETLTISNADGGEMNPEIAYYLDDNNFGNFPAVSGVTTKEKNVISIGQTANMVQVEAPFKADGLTYYSGEGAQLLPSNKIVQPEYLDGTYYTLNESKKVYTATTTPKFDGTVYYTIKTPSSGTTGATIKANLSLMQKTWYSDCENIVDNSSLVDGTEYFTFDQFEATVAEPYYAKDATTSNKVTLYTQKNVPGYFMVIPTTGETLSPASADVTVTITYAVTTQDPNLSFTNDKSKTYKTSEVENVISQKVTLKEFTNGKAYNLRLILGLTSVKVEAEVTDWEAGTVESNLPQNLEI